MHPEAFNWIGYVASQIRPAGRVMDQGGRNVNGSIQSLFNGVTEWVAVDLADAPGVTVVADCGDYVHPEPCDTVVTTELLEHTPRGPDIIRCAYESLRSGGHYVITTAAPGRPAHNASGAPQLEPGEYYQNISYNELTEWLRAAGFHYIHINTIGQPWSVDIRAWARKP